MERRSVKQHGFDLSIVVDGELLVVDMLRGVDTVVVPSYGDEHPKRYKIKVVNRIERKEKLVMRLCVDGRENKGSVHVIGKHVGSTSSMSTFGGNFLAFGRMDTVEGAGGANANPETLQAIGAITLKVFKFKKERKGVNMKERKARTSLLGSEVKVTEGTKKSIAAVTVSGGACGPRRGKTVSRGRLLHTLQLNYASAATVLMGKAKAQREVGGGAAAAGRGEEAEGEQGGGRASTPGQRKRKKGAQGEGDGEAGGKMKKLASSSDMAAVSPTAGGAAGGAAGGVTPVVFEVLDEEEEEEEEVGTKAGGGDGSGGAAAAAGAGAGPIKEEMEVVPTVAERGVIDLIDEEEVSTKPEGGGDGSGGAAAAVAAGAGPAKEEQEEVGPRVAEFGLIDLS